MITKSEIGELLTTLLTEETTSTPDKIKICNMLIDTWYSKEDETKRVVIIDDIGKQEE